MNTRATLMARLEAIAGQLAQRDTTLALLALGSGGLEAQRMDAYSDLDFFVLVAPNSQTQYWDDLSWLSSVHPVAFVYQNTRDGYKVIYDDGILCEWAVFSVDELPSIPFAEGRIVWQRAGFNPESAKPQKPLPEYTRIDVAWHRGEWLTTLWAGLARQARGETLSATQLIQHTAPLHLLALAQAWGLFPSNTNPSDRPHTVDPFNPARRIEQRNPDIAAHLQRWMPGYGHNSLAAKAMLDFITPHWSPPSSLLTHLHAMMAVG